MQARSGESRWPAIVALLVAFSMLAIASGSLVAGTPSPDRNAAMNSQVALGERLVRNMDCNTCHTPKVFTARGPELDTARLLSGHPSDETLPPVPVDLLGPTGWGGVFNNGLTAWAGPWGLSFGCNLTPDSDTGAGEWTEEMFMQAMRTGIHVEDNEPFLPPMPSYPGLTDEELKAIFQYLRSIKPVHNAVPEALPPQPTDRSNQQPPQ